MKKILALSIACMFVLGLALSAVAQTWDTDTIKKCTEWKDMAAAKKEMPPSIQGSKIINGTELKKWMDQGKKIVLLDNRVKEQYDAERIKGSKWLLTDHVLADPKLLDQLKKDDVIVNYCNGVLCWRSPALVLMMTKAGFKNVYWYREGLPEWKKLKYPTE